MKYQPKATSKTVKQETADMIKKQNADQVKSKPAPVQAENTEKVPKGKKLQKVLGKKKTIKDAAGEWEVVDKRETYVIQKNVNSSDEGSELSYD